MRPLIPYPCFSCATVGQKQRAEPLITRTLVRNKYLRTDVLRQAAQPPTTLSDLSAVG